VQTAILGRVANIKYLIDCTLLGYKAESCCWYFGGS